MKQWFERIEAAIVGGLVIVTMGLAVVYSVHYLYYDAPWDRMLDAVF